MYDLLILLLPVAGLVGWYLGRNNSQEKIIVKKPDTLSKDYLVGLNYLLNEQPDKAVDVFIKMLEVDSETVETHLALGNLFRRRGEVDRAIRIHQNLIARPHLEKPQRTQALLALGQDYMRAGVFDRAERLFQEVIEHGEYTAQSTHYLLDIYQQEKDWEQAIAIAHKLEAASNKSMAREIAHFYCELALDARVKVSSEQAYRYLKRAMAMDKNCVRASLLNGDWEMDVGNYKAAIRAYKRVKDQDPDYLSESIAPIVICYEKLGQEAELLDYLHQCLHEYPRLTIILTLSERIQRNDGERAALAFVTEQLHQRPSVPGLKHLIDLHFNLAAPSQKEQLSGLHEITAKLAHEKPIYRCSHCGYAGTVLHWQCPSCRNWNVIKPIHGLEGD